MALSTEFKVGVFTIIGLATLGGTAIMLQGTTFLNKKNHFVSELPNASGVSERTQVRVAGVQVGYVTQVLVKKEGAEIHFDVKASVDIPSDSHIEIRSRGMLGDVFVEIARGENATYLASGAYIPAQGDGADIQKLIANMNSVASDVKKITTMLVDALSGEGENNIKAMITNLEKTAANIASLVENNQTNVTNIISNVNAFTSQLKKLSTDENSAKIANIIDNLNESTDDLKRIIDRVDKGEGSLGQLIVKDDTANEIKSTLAEIKQTVSPFAGIHLGLEDRFEYRFLNAEQGSRIENQFNVLISTTPDRYYLVGLVNSQYGRKVTDTTTTVNGNTTIVQKNIPENTWLWKWNLQVSQKLSFIGANWLGVRLGFFRSTPGFAVDIYTPRNMFIGSAEFYNFDGFAMATDPTYGKRHALNIKLYGNLFLSPHFYLTAGVVNLVLLDKPWPFFGAGVFFTDRDIKGVFASSKDKAQIDDTPSQKKPVVPSKPNTPTPVPAPKRPEPAPDPSLKNQPDKIIAPTSSRLKLQNSETNLAPPPSPDPYPPQSPEPYPQ